MSKQFYRRVLPDSCVDFGGKEGKKLFQESLANEHANIYFKLAAQFRTQDEPAYCGVSTLVMVLNALEVDPGRVWKGPWRWYHESMLDCCMPLEDIKETGINIKQFACLATCNRLVTRAVAADGITDPSDDHKGKILVVVDRVDRFRSDLIRSVTSDNQVLVASYDRQVLGQTGSGHFSPLAAFHQPSDKVLILDVARFKYPPHWVDIGQLHKAMQTVDKSTGQSRAYFMMSLRHDTRPLFVFQLQNNFSIMDQQLMSRVNQWRTFLTDDTENDDDDEHGYELEQNGETVQNCDEAVENAPEKVEHWRRLASSVTKFCELFNEHTGLCCQKTRLSCRIDDEHDQIVDRKLNEFCRNICDQLKKSRIFDMINTISTVNRRVALTALFFAWPLSMDKQTDRVVHLTKLVADEMDKFDGNVVNEITLLRTQIAMMLELNT